jgi:Protein of unknown function (DUF433)
MRIPVATVVSMVADGITVEEICRVLPDLTPEDVEVTALHRRRCGNGNCRCVLGTRLRLDNNLSAACRRADGDRLGRSACAQGCTVEGGSWINISTSKSMQSYE